MTQDELLRQGDQNISKELIAQYRRAFEATKADLSDLWDKLVAESEDGKVRPNDLYRMNRYYAVQTNIYKRLQALGAAENLIMSKGLMRQYRNVFQALDQFLPKSPILEQEYAAQKVIDAVWCADGKHWSNRIWGNKDKLRARLEDGLMDCVSRGVSKDEMVKTLMHDFSVGFNDADRIARTELTFVQNQACRQRYEDAGYDRYKFLAEIDGRTSDICKNLNGKIFYFKDAQVGVNYPPCHPNCRSTVIPVID